MASRTIQLLALGAVLIGAVCLSAPGGIADAAGPTVAVSPASASGVVGGDVALDITVDSVAAPGLGGYLIALKWDPAVLSLTSIADSGWVTGGNIVVVCTQPTIDNGAGQAELDCTPIIGFGPGVTTATTRSLAQAVFLAKAAGSTPIDLAGSYLLNPSSVQVASTLANGSVTVAATDSTPEPATATAAAIGTPEPSATAGAAGTATNSPVAAETSTIVPSSTNTAGSALSNVEAPRTGSGDGSGGSSRTTWWIAGIAAAAVAALAGGTATYGWRRSRRRASDGGAGR